MRIPDIFQLNDCKFRGYLVVVLSIQLGFAGVLLWDSIGLSIPSVRAVVVVLYVSYVPGIVTLRALRLHRLGVARTLIYSVALSLAMLMLVGFLLNALLPLFDVSQPLRVLFIAPAISITVLFLLLVSYSRDRDYAESPRIESRGLPYPTIVVSCFIMVCSVAGATLFNKNNDNSLLFLFLAAVAAIVVLMGFYGRAASDKSYPLLTLSISASLLLHTSLITSYVTGFDIQHEYYLSALVQNNGVWDHTIAYDTNGMLSIVILGPLYSSLSQIPLAWVFKIIYPLIFSLVPLGLFVISEKKLGARGAFLAAFVFMSIPYFSGSMVALARQEVAEFFLVAILLVVFDSRNQSKMRRSLLLMAFSLSLIVSHYALAFIFMGFLLTAGGVMLFADRNRKTEILATGISGRFVFAYIVMSFSWYSFVSGSSSLMDAVHSIELVRRNFIEEFLNPAASQGLTTLLIERPYFLHRVALYVNLAAQGLIVTGVCSTLTTTNRKRNGGLNLVFSWTAFVLMIAGMLVPYLLSILNGQRLYQIGLIFLSPYVVVGSLTIGKLFRRIPQLRGIIVAKHEKPILLSFFLAIFLLLNSGFMYEVAHDHPNIFTLDSAVDGPKFNEREVSGASWLIRSKGDSPVQADQYRALLVNSLSWGAALSLTVEDVNHTKAGEYVFLGTLNCEQGSAIVTDFVGAIYIAYYVSIAGLFDGRDLIFDNGGSRIFY
jgi:uncharacterized membrane protein